MDTNYAKFLENMTILVTGASGFLAKVFVERILSMQPNLKRLYLLVRATDKVSAEQRVHNEIFQKDLFKVLRKSVGNERLNALIAEKVVPISGDISQDNMGVNDSKLLQDMLQDIDIVLNSAATTRFDERYDVALRINTFGAINVLNFAKKCVKLQLLLHVSTAYVCGERSGRIVEKPFAMGETLNGKNKVDINTEMLLVEQKLKYIVEQGCSEEEITQAMIDFGSKRAKLYGWPNAYVFTKSMGEMLLGHNRESMPLVIIRPTIITSTISNPFPGWIEGLKTVDAVIVLYGKGMMKSFLVDQKAICDMIPVDMVVNAMIAAATEHFGEPKSHVIYHVGSSSGNPVLYKKVYELIARYFLKNPVLGRDDLPVVPRVAIFSTLATFRAYTSLRYKLPIEMLGLLSIIIPSKFGDKYKHHHRTFKKGMRLVKLYKPYILFNGIFDDRNLETLRTKTEAKMLDKSFGFNPKCIDWEDYFINTHIPGLMTRVFKK